MKKVHAIHRNDHAHWVGDGFFVKTLFSYNELGAQISPFLLLDYGGPMKFEPAAAQRGVGDHPHRGFETVTVAYEGSLEHRDSAGNAGRIGPGDVQWMTAGSGVVHQEFHAREFAGTGGTMEMAQLWVNLPAKHKMVAPRYQGIESRAIPRVALPDGAGRVRVIAGDFAGTHGPAESFTPINLWDVRLHAGHTVTFNLPAGYTTLVLVLRGELALDENRSARESDLVMYERAGTQLVLRATRDATLLIMNGEPIDEPIAGYGPFVMNTHAEIARAIEDFRTGRFVQSI